MKPLFIKLTDINNTPTYVNANKISSFNIKDYSNGKQGTIIFFSSGEDKLAVEESPEEVLTIINHTECMNAFMNVLK